MKGTKDVAPKLRAIVYSKAALTVGSGDAMPYTSGRTRIHGDTAVKGRMPRRGPLARTLQNLPVIGPRLSPEEAKEWADILKHEFRGK